MTEYRFQLECSTCGGSPILNRGLCASCCQDLRRAERRAARPEKKKKAIPKTSAKRKEKLKEYTPLRKQYLAEHPECEIRLIGCKGKAVEIHHCSTSDKHFLNTFTWKSSCRKCHDTTERVLSAEIRKDKGLLITSVINSSIKGDRDPDRPLGILNRDVEKNVI